MINYGLGLSKGGIVVGGGVFPAHTHDCDDYGYLRKHIRVRWRFLFFLIE